MGLGPTTQAALTYKFWKDNARLRLTMATILEKTCIVRVKPRLFILVRAPNARPDGPM